jgi:phytoene desaturase
MNNRTAIVIGSGVAGMAVAIRLTVQGFSVKVYEKNPKPGGKLTEFEKNGFHFDAGPSLFTQPQNIEELFEHAGEPIEKYFSYKRIDIACKYFFENGKAVQAWTNGDEFANELNEQLQEAPQHAKKYLKKASRLYSNIGAIFVDHSIHKKRTWLNRRVLKALSSVRYAYLFKSLHKYNQKNFGTKEAVQLFDRFATYNGSDPFRAPAMLSMIPHLEQNGGAFYPRGGMISITNALYQLAKNKGVQFFFDTPVQRIIHHEGKIKGVVVNDENVFASVVVSNVDSYFTFKHLLNDPAKVKKIMKRERSSSAVIFYWGIKKEFPELQLHNVFFSKDYKNEFNSIFKLRSISNDPTVYINISSKAETGKAPAGKENWFVMINAPSDFGQNWEKIRSDLRQQVIEKINRMLSTDIEPLIEAEEFMDPLIIGSQTGSFKGSLYGASSNSKWAAFLREPNFLSTIKGLYFCGGTVHPGGGIPLCLKSARIVAELISKDIKKL